MLYVRQGKSSHSLLFEFQVAFSMTATHFYRHILWQAECIFTSLETIITILIKSTVHGRMCSTSNYNVNTHPVDLGTAVLWKPKIKSCLSNSLYRYWAKFKKKIVITSHYMVTTMPTMFCDDTYMTSKVGNNIIISVPYTKKGHIVNLCKWTHYRYLSSFEEKRLITIQWSWKLRSLALIKPFASIRMAVHSLIRNVSWGYTKLDLCYGFSYPSHKRR